MRDSMECAWPSPRALPKRIAVISVFVRRTAGSPRGVLVKHRTWSLIPPVSRSLRAGYRYVANFSGKDPRRDASTALPAILAHKHWKAESFSAIWHKLRSWPPREHRQFTVGLLAAVLLVGGCARTNVWDNLALSAGLNQARMVVGVTASRHLYAGEEVEPTFQVPTSRRIAAAMRGIENGGGFVVHAGLIMGQKLGHPLGAYPFMASLFLWPVGSIVGAIHGAVSEKSARETRPLRTVESAQALFRNALDNQKIEEVIRDRIVQFAQEETGHVFKALPHDTFSAEKVSYKGNPENQRALAEHGIDAILDLHITRFGLAGEEANDPRVSLEMQFRILRFVQGMPFYSGEWEYRGERRRLSVWAANGARLFREELDRVAQSLAGQFEKSLSQASSDTVWQRRNVPTIVAAKAAPTLPRK